LAYPQPRLPDLHGKVIQAHIFKVQAIRQKACQHFTSGCKNYSSKSSHSKDADYVPLTLDFHLTKKIPPVGGFTKVWSYSTVKVPLKYTKTY
jgi:hypothetical protein